MTDPRNRQLAELLVDTCVGVQPGWQVLVVGTPAGQAAARGDRPRRRRARRLRAPAASTSAARRSRRARGCARRRSSGSPIRGARSTLHALETCDALIVVDAPENTRDARRHPGGADRRRCRARYRPAMERVFRARGPVGRLPVPDAGARAGRRDVDRRVRRLPLRRLPARLGRRARAHAALRRPLRRSRRGADRRRRDRPAALDRRVGRCRSTPAARTSPAASSSAARSRTPPRARSPSPSSRPSTQAARSAGSACGSRAAASSTPRRRRTRTFLLETLDSDEGARRLGELGIGCNPGITRYMKNTLFDEKIDGTVHLALGNGMPDLGGDERLAHPLGHRQGPAAGGDTARARRRGRAAGRRVADLTRAAAPLRQRPIVALVAAEVVSSLGSQMTFLALPWFVLADDRLADADGRRARGRARADRGPRHPVAAPSSSRWGARRTMIVVRRSPARRCSRRSRSSTRSAGSRSRCCSCSSR